MYHELTAELALGEFCNAVPPPPTGDTNADIKP